MGKFNKNLLEEMKRDTEEKAQVLTEEERVKDLYQGKETDELINRFLNGKKVVEELSVDLLDDNENNHFHRIEGEKWEEFVGSVKEFGILNPLIVRKADGDRYEILAGHNRKYAAIESGLTTVPCIVTDVDDVDASVIVGITNNQREETTDLEWGWSYRSTYEAIKGSRGGDRKSNYHDGNLNGSEDEESNYHDGNLKKGGKRAMDMVAQKYGVGAGTVQRKIRLTYLIPQLYDALASSKASQGIMVDLSYLSRVDQINMASEIANEKLIVTEDIASSLKKMAQERNGGEIGIDPLYNFIRTEGERKPEAPKRPKKYLVNEGLFPSGLKKQEREGYIEKALLYILNNGINLSGEGE